MKKAFLGIFLIVLMVSGLAFVSSMRFGTAQSGTSVSGILNFSTTWMQSGSPYTLTGNLLVNISASLTIEPGVTVDFNGFYIQVNGTLSAQGTPDNPITFNIAKGPNNGNSAIEFTSSSQSWNDKAETGSKIENAIINSAWSGIYPTIVIDSVSPKIDKNTITCPPNLNSNIAINIEGADAAPIVSNNSVVGEIAASGGLVCNNTIADSSYAGIFLSGNATAKGNTISGSTVGIYASSPSLNYYSASLIQENLIFNNTFGIELEIYAYSNSYPRTVITQNNTVTNNEKGIQIDAYSASAIYSISENNIYNNLNYNFLLAGSFSSDINATYNWWGINDAKAINQTIYDFKDNFALGTVNFSPFLSAPNSQAPLYVKTPPTPTPTPSPTPSLTPTPTPTPEPSTSPQANLNVTPNPVGVGQEVTVSFGLNQLPPSASSSWTGLTFTVTDPTGHSVTLGPFKTDATGETSTQYTPTMVGNYILQASFSGQTIAGTYYEPSSSNTVTLAVQQQPISSPYPTPTPTPSPTSAPNPTPTPLPIPNLSFYCISSTTTSGFNVQIQGSLTYDGAGLSGAGIQLSDSITGGKTWQDLAYVNTDNNGSFTCVWYPSASGNYGIEATWSGDNDYSNVNAVYNFAIAPFDNQAQNVFSVTSNTTLTSLTFDSATNELSFGVSGPSGTTGLTKVCIPQSLIPDISKINVTLDGAAINYNSVSQDNVWVITFTYHHSSHVVDIAIGSPASTVSEFPTWIILPLFAVIILLSTVLIRKRIALFLES